MPDISMCAIKDCAKSYTCYRHKNSGTKPCEYRQAYFAWPEDKQGPCDYYWPIHDDVSFIDPYIQKRINKDRRK